MAGSSYLFGDSSQAPYHVDYIAVIRDAVPALAHVLRAWELEQALRRERQRRLRRTGDLKIELEKLKGRLYKALDVKDYQDGATQLASCSTTIIGFGERTIKERQALVQEQLSRALERIDSELISRRTESFTAIAQLLSCYDAFDVSEELEIGFQGASGYKHHLYLETGIGLSFCVELRSACEQFSQKAARVASFVEDVTVSVPELRGWRTKTEKMIPYQLDKLFIVEGRIGIGSKHLRLRKSIKEDAPGFDIRVTQEEHVQVRRIDKEGVDNPYVDCEAEGAQQLLRLMDTIWEATGAMRAARGVVTDIHIDDKVFHQHPNPVEFVPGIIRLLAPVVDEITKHSPDGELTLKQTTQDGYRKELFVSFDELCQPLSELSDRSKALFSPLKLADGPRVFEMVDEGPTGVIPLNKLSANLRASAVTSDMQDDDEADTGRPPPPVREDIFRGEASGKRPIARIDDYLEEDEEEIFVA